MSQVLTKQETLKEIVKSGKNAVYFITAIVRSHIPKKVLSHSASTIFRKRLFKTSLIIDSTLY